MRIREATRVGTGNLTVMTAQRTAPRAATLSPPNAPAEKRAFSEPRPGPAKIAPRLAGFELVSAAGQKKLTDVFLSGDARQRHLLAEYLMSPSWRAASPAQRELLVDVMLAVAAKQGDRSALATGELELADALTSFFTLAATPVLAGSLPHLHRLATTPLHAALQPKAGARTNHDALAELVTELADPARIDQDHASTCTVTSVQQQLVKARPHDYARMVTGLLLDGKTTFPNGAPLGAAWKAVEPSTTARRTLAENVFQASLMQAADPGHEYTWTENDRDTFATTQFAELPDGLQVLFALLFPIALILLAISAKRSGLTLEQLATPASAVFGTPYAARPCDGLKTLETIERRLGFDHEPVIVRVTPFSDIGKDSAHALQVVGIDHACTPAALIMRNPWGSDALRLAGDPLANVPGVTHEDPRKGTVRMPLTPAGLARVAAVLAPVKAFP